MRLWSIHPKYLDASGLVACWREALLAQAVLNGLTKGYKNHPQLERFKNAPNSLIAIGNYLVGIHDEATSRGYSFNSNKIFVSTNSPRWIPVSTDQVSFEVEHLLNKLYDRDKSRYHILKNIFLSDIEVHPLFVPYDGPVESWEKQ